MQPFTQASVAAFHVVADDAAGTWSRLTWQQDIVSTNLYMSGVTLERHARIANMARSLGSVT